VADGLLQEVANGCKDRIRTVMWQELDGICHCDMWLQGLLVGGRGVTQHDEQWQAVRHPACAGRRRPWAHVLP
jgi:hypothetical protein